MTTTLRAFTSTTPGTEGRSPTTPAGPSTDFVQSLDFIVVESCHSTWVFDPGRLEFCRILKGIEVGARSVATEWRPYWQVDLDADAEGFTVYLNEDRTRLIRSWRHTKNCSQCGGCEKTELSADEIHRTLEAYHAGWPPRSEVR